MNKKSCKKCGEEKTSDLFYNRDNSCKECRKSIARSYREKNLEKVLEYDRRRYHENEHRKDVARKCFRRALNDGRHTEYSRQWRSRNTEKYKAHMIVKSAIRNGSLSKCGCRVCGSLLSQAHHDDYSRPLDVVWLCPLHHAQIHRTYEP